MTQAIRKTKSMDERCMGPEPDFRLNPDYPRAQAYSWYTYFNSYDDALALFQKHYPRDRSELKKLLSLKRYSLTITVMVIPRMMSRGFSNAEAIAWFNRKIDELLVRNAVEVEDNVVVLRKAGKTAADVTSDLIAEIEDVYDAFVVNGYKSDFNFYNWVGENKVSAGNVAKIVEYLRPRMDELEVAKAKTDDQVVEGYNHLTKAAMDRAIAFYRSIITEAAVVKENVQRVRKPRAKKAIPAEKLVARMKYKPADDELKIVSLNPTRLVEATDAWIYNAKYRTLTRYVPMKDKTLTVKGATIENFDPVASITKKLRQPAESLKLLNGAGKVALRTFMENIKAKPSVPTGRMNTECMIIKATK